MPGYYHPEDEFWHHAVAKFWFANSLGTVPVYPSWLLHDAVAMVLVPDAKRWTPRGARRWAFVLPRVDSEGPGAPERATAAQGSRGGGVEGHRT